jgi:hypothetical protein
MAEQSVQGCIHSVFWKAYLYGRPNQHSRRYDVYSKIPEQPTG